MKENMKYIQLNNVFLIIASLIVGYYNIWIGLVMAVMCVISVRKQIIEKQKSLQIIHF